MAISIPDRLREPSFRFVLVKAKDKSPIEKDWQKNANYPCEDPKLSRHLGKDGNYGVLCGINGLAVIDADSPEVAAAVEESLPQTFTVQTGRGGRHFYYRCADLPGPLRLARPGDAKGTIGDVQSTGKQVIGPGSIHPNGNAYTVLKDLPLASIKAEQIRTALSDFLPPPETDTLEDMKRELPNRSRDVELDSLKVQDVISMGGLKGLGGKFRGSCPWHGSNTGHNFEVDISKNAWYCFRHGTGGGPLHAIAVQEKVLDCGDCVPGALRGEKFKRALEIAQDKHGLCRKEAMSSGRLGRKGSKGIEKTAPIGIPYDLEHAEIYKEDGKLGAALIKDGIEIEFHTVKEWQEIDDKIVKYLHYKFLSMDELPWNLPEKPEINEDSSLLTDIMRCNDEYIEFPDDITPASLAIWQISTAFVPFIPRSPLLSLFGPPISGKGQILDQIYLIGYRGFKMSRPTPAVLYRGSHWNKTTWAMDELQDLGQEDWNSCMNILKCTYDGTPIPRCNWTNTGLDIFRLRPFMAVSYKDQVPPNDVMSRSISITMPRGAGNKILVDETEEHIQLRSRLLALRLRLFTRPDLVKEYRDKATETLNLDEVGLKNRPKDIANSLLFAGSMFNQTEEIIELIKQSTEKEIEQSKDTFEAFVYYGLDELWKDFHKDKIYTTFVRERVAQTLFDLGDLKDKADLTTRRVNKALYILGYKLPRGGQHIPYIDKLDRTNIKAHEVNGRRYPPLMDENKR
ncbi:MAG: bifunctional DNA primase/polymerase [Methanomassiliicoccus sp.]|nr:bifunctional DNA primase/polymerase [Methanomassiliicoccus sp.]